jgi:beta-xylosidase
MKPSPARFCLRFGLVRFIGRICRVGKPARRFDGFTAPLRAIIRQKIAAAQEEIRMMKPFKAFMLGLGLAAAPLAVHAADPAPAATMKLPDMPLHDPFIVADPATKTYYLYTSNVGSLTSERVTGIMVYESKDLLNWSKPKIVFRLPKESWANSGGWAPEVHKWKGAYYLFTTVANESAALPPAPDSKRHPYRRGTVLARATSPEGPFELVNGGEPIAPASLMTLDGTLYVDPQGKPWEVYAHEWLQFGNGTMEAIPLDDNLKAIGDPVVLFKASDGKWVKANPQPEGDVTYVTDGPELIRTKDKHLLMLWSSWSDKGYVQSIARSDTGDLKGPWTQLEPLIWQDSGHGMVFKTFDGKLMLVLHRPFKNARGKLYEVKDAGDHIEIVKERTDLDGDKPAP